MTATACNKWKGLFTVGEEFDDEDLLEADWTCPSEQASSTAPSVAPSSESLHVQQSSVSLSSGQGENASESGSVLTLRTPACGTINALPDLSMPCHQSISASVSSLRVPVSSLQPSSNPINPPPPASFRVPQRDLPPQDDFDDWDVDLEELDSIHQMVSEPQNNPAAPLDNISPAKRMRPSAPEVSSRGRFGATSSVSITRPLVNTSFVSTIQGPMYPSTPLRNANYMYGPATPASRFPRPVTPRPPVVSPPCQRGASTPRTPLQPHGSLFHSVSSTTESSSTFTSHALNTPVLTNHLVQLVSAANKTPQRPQSRMMPAKARRFPGPAGALPLQASEQSLDDIVVAVPQTPAHGAVARLRSAVSSSQVSEEEEFSRGPWAVMKTEMGLDEKNPSCFLHSYSVVMVLRKAALRQLAKNKVPNMAVVLKSITHTHADAKAIFRDPTGEMQGMVHRRLVEERLGELKTGAVLLLKQVGVFSPSHRNHYLNVTPNNLLRIYPPDGVFHNSQPSHSPLELTLHSESTRPAGGPVSLMELHFDDEDDSENVFEENWAPDGLDAAAVSNELCQAPTRPTGDTAWDTDDLDELLGELPVDAYDGLR
ncbi:homologous recombination OB-fold protein isoform X2 [Onychostoma macrolepis]|uniref:homologous recombination OB-fold protein isoform X2 n=1 Tax=Onychostoma macrolepis TaxID=369639 RepID=UPI00272B402D|nr:homologous recombination OB-fold protein isoform X2 [Onychostoma macrolepis]